MKAIMIIYNQAITEKVDYLMDFLEIRGFSKWHDVQGRGTVSGVPHLGNHTWPEMNSAIMMVVEDEKVQTVLNNVKKLNSVNDEIGIRAFVWNIEEYF
jgi:nitrogen regulatory protein PII